MIRQIVHPNHKRLILNIPAEFVGHDIEIIAFRMEDNGKPYEKPVRRKPTHKQKYDRLMKYIKLHPIKLPEGYKFNREELYE